MNFYEATQEAFDSIECKGLNKPAVEAIVRCRCQPNKCSRPVCSGCVQCLGRCGLTLSHNEQTKVLADFLTF